MNHHDTLEVACQNAAKFAKMQTEIAARWEELGDPGSVNAFQAFLPLELLVTLSM